MNDEVPPSLSEMRILRMLVRQPGWLEDLTPQARKGIVAKLLQLMQKADARGREVIGVAKVLVAMERNDLERCKQLLRVDFDGEEEGDRE